jgi:hypothetical protein
VSKKSKSPQDDWFARHFPTKSARDAADLAIDAIDPREPMTTYLDTWVATYRAAGGRGGPVQ